jgi:hypothetical protein
VDATTKSLELSRNNIADADLVHLAGHTALVWLYLNNTGITGAGLKHLAGLTALELLDLVGTGITDAGIKDLRASLPNCQIYR